MKINNYKPFLDEKEKQLTSLTLPAWKQRTTLESQIKDLPPAAIQAHKNSLADIQHVVLDIIPDGHEDIRQELHSLMQKIPHLAPATPRGKRDDQIPFEEDAQT